MENILLASLVAECCRACQWPSCPVFSLIGILGAATFGFQAFMAGAKMNKFSKTDSSKVCSH